MRPYANSLIHETVDGSNGHLLGEEGVTAANGIEHSPVCREALSPWLRGLDRTSSWIADLVMA
jgi:hypothetical protein